MEAVNHKSGSKVDDIMNPISRQPFTRNSTVLDSEKKILPDLWKVILVTKLCKITVSPCALVWRYLEE